MNCVNHPDTPVAAYCQNCGKPMCSACMRTVGDVVFCEQCLAARIGGAGNAPAGYPAGVIPPPPGANPALATLLGFIPGVGAMYNGQYVKAIVHVLVFVVLVAISGSHGIFGIFVAAWVLYQVFDANQTAKARREGLPLPDPFGLNELSFRMGMSQAPSSTGYHASARPAGWQTPVPGSVPGPVPGTTAGPVAAGFVSGTPEAQAGAYTPVSGAQYGQSYAGPYTQPYPPPGTSWSATPPIPPIPPVPTVPPEAELEAARREPIGAIVLIGLGMLFLFNTLGIFSFDWIDHGWPLLIIGIGIWLLIRRMRQIPRPPQPPAATPSGNDRPLGGPQ
jgi:TM2 domain-containing membrane protein YozV